MVVPYPPVPPEGRGSTFKDKLVGNRSLTPRHDRVDLLKVKLATFELEGGDRL